MLPEISLNILDISQNSISAGATLIEIKVDINTEKKQLFVMINDNGKGMSEGQLAQVADPFFTTRTTRNVGLGIPFFKQAAECTGGDFSISSVPGKGTGVMALFCTDHIDCMPLGDINATIHSLVTMNESIDFYYEYKVNHDKFELDTREIRKIVGDVSFQEPEISEFLRGYLEENEAEINKKQNYEK